MGAFLELLFITFLLLLLGSMITPFPINDSGVVRYNTMPWATLVLIGLNIVIFMVWLAPDILDMHQAITDFGLYSAQYSYADKVWTYGFRETYLQEGQSIGAFTTFTSMFMHADFSHLIGNMIYLWAFGRRVEDACGPWRFFLFYLFAGMVSAMGYSILTREALDLPGIGASGAISGVMGAYLILFPMAKMSCLWMLAIVIKGIGWALTTITGGDSRFQWTVQIPAIFVLGLFVLDNLLPTFDTVETGELVGGVNYVAHMAGFLSALGIFLFVRKDLFVRYWSGRAL